MSTTLALRAWLTAKSMGPAVASMPKSAARPTVRDTAAVSRNSLAGTQPRCKHVPPTLSRSIERDVRPAAAA